MKKLLLLSSLLITSSVLAMPNIPAEEQLGDLIIEEVPANHAFLKSSQVMGIDGGVNGGFTGGGDLPGTVGGAGGGGYTGGGYSTGSGDPIETAGRVISTARDIVALGEAIYELVSKGKPHNVTEYAPISVVPKDPTTGEPVDMFDLEGFSMPVEKNYVATIKDGAGREAVKFSYRVMYSYGGSYNGTGKYLANVIIIPGNIVTKYGWDFSASMKLSGMMNHGTRANPIAGIMVTIKYKMDSWSKAYERNDTIHISGTGQLTPYMTR